jgi:hypothetical protein
MGRWPVFDLIRQIPPFNIAATSSGFQAVYCFCVPILAGFGLDEALQPRPTVKRLRRLSRALLIFAAAGALVLGLVYMAMRVFRAQALAIGRAYIVTHVYGRPPHPYPLEVYLSQLNERYRQVLSVLDPARLTLYAPLIFAALAGLLFWTVYRGWVGRSRAAVLCVALTLADLWSFGAGFNPTMAPEDVLPPTPALTWLSQHISHDRITEIGSLLPPNTGMPYGLSDIRGYDVGIGRYAALMGTMSTNADGYILSTHNDHIMDLTGVRYLLSAQALPDRPDLKLVYDREIKIYERARPLPRAYLAGSYEVIPSAAALRAALDQPDVVNGQKVLLEEQPSIALPASQVVTGTARIQSYTPNALTVVVENPQAGMLVLSDAAYPGWHALIDGQESKLYRANFAFRAVAVPAGSHVISFVYQPISVRLGVALSAATLALLAILGSLFWWKQRHGS